MKGSKLLETLNLFSKEEIVSLDKFLRSPYFSTKQTKKEIYPLFQYIMSFSANWEHPSLEKEKIFNHLFPNKKLIKGKIDKLMSALLKQIHQFISIHFENKSKKKIHQEIILIDFFRQRNIKKFADQYLEKLKKNYKKESIQDKNYFFDGFLINTEIIQTHLIYSKDFTLFDLAKANQPLDIYYMLQKLEYACFLLSIDRFLQPIDMDRILQFLDALKPICADQGILDTPLLKIYFQTYEMLKKVGDMDKAYFDLKALIEKNEKIIPYESIKTLSGLMRNFMLSRMNLGAHHLIEEVFFLYQTHLEKGYLNHENGLLASTIKNVVSAGVRSKYYDWVFQFLLKYKNQIKGTQFPEDAYHYNLAYYYFGQKKYEQALELLADKYEDLYYKISAKRMELKIYFETESSILPSKIDAFKVFIFRLSSKIILDHVRSRNNHYINFLRQLSNPQTKLDPKRIDRLILKIKASKLLEEKDWLLEKLEDLKK